MAFLAALAAKLIEMFLVWFVKFITVIVKERKEISDEDNRAAENLKKLKGSKDNAERRRNAEDLLNDN
jgi:hypothetical protein